MFIKLLEGESVKYAEDADVNIIQDDSGNNIKIEINGNVEIQEDITYLYAETENDEFEELPSFYIFNMSDNIYYTLPLTNASSSGDPHIDPVFGDSYELPDDPHVYRMIQGDNFIMNAETRKITNKEQEEIKTYHENLRNNTNKTDNPSAQELYLHGCFYSKIYIKSENQHLMIDIENKQVHVGTQSVEYFKIHKLDEIHHSFGSYKNNPIESATMCEFEHEKYGKIELYIFYYENPQINNGFHLNMKYEDTMHGLLIREHNIQNYILSHLTDVRKLVKVKQIKSKPRSVLLTQPQIQC